MECADSLLTNWCVQGSRVPPDLDGGQKQKRCESRDEHGFRDDAEEQTADDGAGDEAGGEGTREPGVAA